jgi:hypothetical protein
VTADHTVSTPSSRGQDPRRRYLLRSGWFDHQWYAAQTSQPMPSRGAAVDHYLEVGAPTGLAPNQTLASLQGGERDPQAGGENHDTPPDFDDPQLALDVELVRASGLFDAEFYLTQTPILALGSTDPVVHFCRVGWRLLMRPRSDFDVWWYWSNHLDPRHEVINPFVHYLAVGGAAGLTGRPEEQPEARTAVLPSDRAIRRVCLFAGYDQEALLDDYVVEYLRELSRHADVYYLCDGHLDASELAKLDGLVAGAWAIRHGAYDFGSYSMLARDLVGWETLASYDEVLLVNDSCYLLRDLDDVFARMDARPCAWWGLQATKGLTATRDNPSNAFTEPIAVEAVREQYLASYEQDPIYDFHIGSYFLAFRGPVIDDAHFRRILDAVHPQRSKLTIILKYEIGLTHYLIGNGYRFDTFVDALYPFHPLFTSWYFALLERGFPLLKKFLLYRNHYDVPDLKDWKSRVLAVVPGASLEAAERNLARIAPDDDLARSFAIVTGPGGVVSVPAILTGQSFRRADNRSPTFEHWWAFPVSFETSTLPDNSRAIFEAVRHDPSIKKIVLTRARRVELSGENVVVAPLQSPEGQHHLMRAGQVLVNDDPRATLGQLSLAHPGHRVLMVRDGCSMQLPERARREARYAFRSLAKPAARAMLTSSDVDQLAMLTRHYPVFYDTCWRTGLPATDFLLAPEPDLPDDLRAEAARLHRSLEGRRLLLFAPAAGRSLNATAHRFTPAQVENLAGWARRNDVVLGLREDPRDTERSYHRQLGNITKDLSMVKFPSLPVLLRAASGVLTDFSGVALDFLATGRPVLSFIHDLEEVRGSLLLDPEQVMPSPVCLTFDELMAALEAVFDGLDAAARHRYARSRELFFDRVDSNNAQRTVNAVRATYLRDPS